MDHNREASQHLTSFLQLFFWSVRLGQGVRDIAFLLLKLHQVRFQDLSKLAAARHRQSWVVKTWQKPRWGKAGKEEKLNKTTMPHISVFKKPRETCQMGSCSHGMFFATIPYRFRYRFVIVLVPSARSHFRSPCKRLRATKHMRLSKLVQSHGAANVYSQLQVSLLGGLSLHSVLCKFLTPENSPYISNIPDRVLTPHIMYVYPELPRLYFV